MSMGFKRRIRVGKNATDMMKLPCVYGCYKDGDGNLYYELYDWDSNGENVKVIEGEWLCEDFEGQWKVLSEREYLKWLSCGT